MDGRRVRETEKMVIGAAHAPPFLSFFLLDDSSLLSGRRRCYHTAQWRRLLRCRPRRMRLASQCPSGRARRERLTWPT